MKRVDGYQKSTDQRTTPLLAVAVQRFASIADALG
jgi:hypothetical protein